MRIAIASDAAEPQVNGVVQVNRHLAEALRQQGHDVRIFSSEGMASYPLPTYPQIRLAWRPRRTLAERLDAFAPEALHIATEGPIGLAARAHALRRHWPFTTHLHTRFAEYLRLRTGLPLSIGYALLRWFHGPAQRVLVPAASLADDLYGYGIRHTVVLPHGVDCTVFQPRPGPLDELLKSTLPAEWPLFLYAGRIAIEKNIETFLSLDLPGIKVVCGDGPDLMRLRTRYPSARFMGAVDRQTLAAFYRLADVLAFPSRTDTFGLVMLEAMACGTPVAAYAVPGPIDVFGESSAGALRDDLRSACLAALRVPGSIARAHAVNFSWPESAERFTAQLAMISARESVSV